MGGSRCGTERRWAHDHRPYLKSGRGQTTAPCPALSRSPQMRSALERVADVGDHAEPAANILPPRSRTDIRKAGEYCEHRPDEDLFADDPLLPCVPGVTARLRPAPLAAISGSPASFRPLRNGTGQGSDARATRLRSAEAAPRGRAALSRASRRR